MYKKQSSMKLNVASLPAGIYSLRITSDGNTETRQLKIN